jgi:hypothetical protein
MEELRLRIVFEGDGALVRDGRVSLSLFLEPLRFLLTAYQKTAAGILRQTGDSDGDGAGSTGASGLFDERFCMHTSKGRRRRGPRAAPGERRTSRSTQAERPPRRGLE